jgi:hypothetical protein
MPKLLILIKTPVRLFFLVSIFVLLFIGVGFRVKAANEPMEISEQILELSETNEIYLPFTTRAVPTLPVMLGLYSQNGPALQSTMDNEFHAIEAWSGKRISIAGTFIDIQIPDPYFNVGTQLEMMWQEGYTPFINLETTHTAGEIARGNLDSALRGLARAYRDTFALEDGGRMAFIAPLQEMNSCQRWGCWTVYGGEPEDFKAAYLRIRQIFHDEGVPAGAVKWVFAPNGWSDPTYDHPFEEYYPGDQVVDVVAFSAYNFGDNCRGSVWQTPIEVYNNPNASFPQGQFLDRMRAMAPEKPIFIAQTATSAYFVCGEISRAMKDVWLRDAYHYLASYPGVKVILYFNKTNAQGYDWPFYIPGDPANQYVGYINGVSSPSISYVSPQDLVSAEPAAWR